MAPVDHLEEFHKRFPAFQLEDGLFVQAGRDVMTDIYYNPGSKGPGPVILSLLGA